MNNKMADDYMDSLIKEIETLQAENERLRTALERARTYLPSKSVLPLRTKTQVGDDIDLIEDALKGGS